MTAITRQRQLEIDGFLVGDGTDYPFMFLLGLDTAPYRVKDVDFAGQDGSFSGNDYLDGKKVQLGVGIVDDFASNNYQDKIDRLKYVLRPRNRDIVVSYKYNTPRIRRFYARPRRMAYKSGDSDFALGLSDVVIEFFLGDPVVYDDAALQLTAGVPVATGGLAFNFGFNVAFGSATSGGMTCQNAGIANSFPMIRLDGPLSSPVIWNDATGEHWSTNISLAAGEWLDIDMKARTALLNGTSSRYSAVRANESTWFSLVPNNNVLRLTAGGGSGSMTVTWRNAYL